MKKKAKAVLIEDPLEAMLSRLQLGGLRDRLDSLLDEAVRADLNLREALTMLFSVEIARRDERRIQMGTSIAKSNNYQLQAELQ